MAHSTTSSAAARFLPSSPPYDGAPGNNDAAPSYQRENYLNIWENWDMVNGAYRRMLEAQTALAGLEPELKEKAKEGERLKENSLKLFGSFHKKPRVGLPMHFRSGSIAKAAETKELRRREFEVAHREETTHMMQLEELQTRVDTIRAQMKRDAELASTIDQVFELLAATVASSGINSGPAAMDTEELLAASSESYTLAQDTVTDLTRARVTVQHAHHYYTIVLQTLDAVRGTALGRAVLGGLGEVSKNLDYQVAAETASKAQICFNDTVRVLTPHLHTLPPDILADFDGLKEMGLLQASKIYGLMYGWKTRSPNVAKSVQLMLERQEIAFAKLTRLAVWIQDRVPVCEAQLRASRDNRDQARRDLVEAWKSFPVD